MMGLLSYLIFSPILGVLIIQCLPSKSVAAHRTVAIWITLLPLLLTFYLYTQFQNGQGMLFGENHLWFQLTMDWSIQYSLGVDGLSLPLVALTALVSTIATVASMYIKERTKMYYSLFLLLEVGMLGVFLAHNLFLFFLFFELTLVTMFFLISIWGYAGKERAAFHFLLYNGIGSAFLLIGIVGILVLYGSVEYDVLAQVIPASSSSPILWSVFAMLLVAFAIKLPIFPFHRWMLVVHVEAPPSVVMVHAGILLKIGAYGLLRFGVGFFPNYINYLATLFALLGLINLLYGAVMAFVQQELKSVLAYSSISHMGIVLLGIAAINQVGLQGAVFQSISHGLISALFFFLVAALYERTHTTGLKELGGLAKSMPVLSGYLMVASLALLGLPGLSGFVSEFFSILGLFELHPVYAAISTLGLILAAVYTLRAYLSISFGAEKKAYEGLDIGWKEWLPMLIIVVVIGLIGVYPDTISHTLTTTLQTLALGWGDSR
jgi:NADH-quinone oxidoreductase subunit M